MFTSQETDLITDALHAYAAQGFGALEYGGLPLLMQRTQTAMKIQDKIERHKAKAIAQVFQLDASGC